MRVKIIPHGILRKTWPLDYECEASSPSEAMTALTATHKIPRAPGNNFWQVRLVDYDNVVQINCPLTSNELHVVPDFSGGGGVVKIIVGVVLIAAAAYVSIQFPAAGPLVAFAASTALSIGASLVLGGILELLTPAPKQTTPGVAASNYLGAPKNTVASNTRIAIGFGRYLVYGQFLSVNIQSDIGQIGANARRASTGYVANPVFVDPNQAFFNAFFH